MIAILMLAVRFLSPCRCKASVTVPRPDKELRCSSAVLSEVNATGVHLEQTEQQQVAMRGQKIGACTRRRPSGRVLRGIPAKEEEEEEEEGLY